MIPSNNRGELVVEHAENVDLKRKIFTDLARITRPDIILATNTSSISITKIAAATNRPDKVPDCLASY